MDPSLILVAFYVLLIVGTVARQFPRISAHTVLRWDAVGLLPGFSFFAPNPGGRDYSLVYRWFDSDVPSQWHDPYALGRRSWWTALWNPRKRVRKAVIDLSGSLAQDLSASSDRSAAMVSVPYLLLLEHVTGMARDRGGSAVQFAVLVSAGRDGDRQIEVLFSSAVHRVEP